MMEQIEFENCIEKMKKRKSEGDIKTAAKIADKVPWDEVEDVNVLMFVASIYEEAGKYDDAKNVLEYAYDIAPIKNRLFYSLAFINIKCKNLNDAINYYRDFCNTFPEDSRKNILKYYILKLKGASYDQQERVLSEYVKEEKDEKMTFELALVADKQGKQDEVIEYCDYIIDFYGVKKNGYGKNALLLKKKYTTLTDDEEKLLRNVDTDYVESEESEYEYTNPPILYNETKIDEDKKNIPVEKVTRVINIAEQRKIDELLNSKNDDLDEESVQNRLQVSYTPDEESYLEKEKNGMAFLKPENKEKLRILINKFKKEAEIENSPFNQYRSNSIKQGRRKIEEMKLNETKLNMIIEAYSKDEGVEIAKKELNYIHDILAEKVSIAKASAYNMNEKGFSYYVDKIEGKDLIIENAGQLKNEILDEIEEFIINKKGSTLFALVDVINNFDKLATERPSFIARFDIYSVLSERPQETLEVTKEEVEEYRKKHTDQNNVAEEKENVEKKANENTQDERKTTTDLNNSLKENSEKSNEENAKNIKKKSINELSIEDFVDECKIYANSIDCVLTSQTVSAIYEKAEEMEGEKIPLTKETAEALIEEAADRAEKPKLFSKPKYDKEGCLIIQEEHLKF